MSEEKAKAVLLGIEPMPENMTVEQVFLDAHVVVTVIGPF